MHPILIDLGKFKVHTFGFIVAIGVITAALLCRREARRRGLDAELVLDLAVKTALIGFLGSRLLFVAINWDEYGRAPLEILKFWKGGLVWYGGFITAFLYALWSFKRKQLPIGVCADIFAPAVILGLAIGRVGCLMAGDDHGKIVHVPPGQQAPWWTLTFPDPPPIGYTTDGRPVHGPDAPLMDPDYRGKPLWPAQPLMTLGDLAIFGILMSLRKRLAAKPGAIAALLLVLYPIKRLGIEQIRGDAARKFLIPDIISTSTAISVPILIIGIAAFLYILRRTSPAAPEPAKVAIAPARKKPQ